MEAKLYEMTLDEGECFFLKGYLEYVLKMYSVEIELNKVCRMPLPEPLKSIVHKLLQSVRTTFKLALPGCQMAFSLSLSTEEKQMLKAIMERAIEHFNKRIAESGALAFCAGKYYADRIRLMTTGVVIAR